MAKIEGPRSVVLKLLHPSLQIDTIVWNYNMRGKKLIEIGCVTRRQSDLNFTRFAQHFFLFTVTAPESRLYSMQTKQCLIYPQHQFSVEELLMLPSKSACHIHTMCARSS